MSASIQDVKKFLQEKADGEDSDTLVVTRLGNTSGAEGYRIFFKPAQEVAEQPSKKKAPAPSKKKD